MESSPSIVIYIIIYYCVFESSLMLVGLFAATWVNNVRNKDKPLMMTAAMRSTTTWRLIFGGLVITLE